MLTEKAPEKGAIPIQLPMKKAVAGLGWMLEMRTNETNGCVCDEMDLAKGNITFISRMRYL